MANKINGLHLMVDGQVSDSSVFDKKVLNSLLKQLIQDLEMVCIWGPEFKEVELDPSKLTGDTFQDEGGTSGFCMINKSHISIHVWPLRRFFCMDICSCDTFNGVKALRTIKNILRVESIRVQAIERTQDVNQMTRVSDNEYEDISNDSLLIVERDRKLP